MQIFLFSCVFISINLMIFYDLRFTNPVSIMDNCVGLLAAASDYLYLLLFGICGDLWLSQMAKKDYDIVCQPASKLFSSTFLLLANLFYRIPFPFFLLFSLSHSFMIMELNTFLHFQQMFSNQYHQYLYIDKVTLHRRPIK